MESVLLRMEENIAIIELNRPEKMNALNVEMVRLFCDLLNKVRSAGEARALIVAAKGSNFSVGADINGLYAMNGETATEFRRAMRKAVEGMLNAEFPVIFALKGYSLGGGLELSEAADIRIASHDTVLGQPEVAIGINAGAGGNVFLPALIGRGKASFLSMTGKKISAEEAMKIGLVDVIAKGEVLQEALETARLIASYNRETVDRIKKTIIAASLGSWQTSFDQEEEDFVYLATNREVKARMEKFLKK